MNEFEVGRQVERLTRESEEIREHCRGLADTVMQMLRRGNTNAEIEMLQIRVGSLERQAVEVGLLQKISRWWNRSHYRAIEQQLSELRNKQIMDNTEALNKIGQVKANLAEAKAEIIAEINALKALVAGGASQADILAGLDELITESALLANVSPSLPTEPPTEPPAQG